MMRIAIAVFLVTPNFLSLLHHTLPPLKPENRTPRARLYESQAHRRGQRNEHGMWDQLKNFDFELIRWLNGFAGANDFVDYVAWEVTQITLIKGGVMVGLLWGSWSIDRPDRDTTSDMMRAFFGVVFAVFIGRLLQLLLPFRARPLHEPSLDFRPLEYMPTNVLEGWSSFPSDHGVLYGAIAVAIFCRSRVFGVLALVWTLVVILLPRVYAGLHYPIDVIFGCALGATLMAVVMTLPVPEQATAAIGRWRTRHAALFQTLMFMFMFEVATLFQDTRNIVGKLGDYLGLSL